MLDNEFLRCLGIREELLPKGYQPRNGNGIDRNSEEEAFDGPLGKPFEVHRDDLNRRVWDHENDRRIISFEHAVGLILTIYPEDAEVDPFGLGFSQPQFKDLIDAMAQPIENIVGCHDRDGGCWYYLPPNFTDLECLSKINRVAKQ
jgi:hypothetical protein